MLLLLPLFLLLLLLFLLLPNANVVFIAAVDVGAVAAAIGAVTATVVLGYAAAMYSISSHLFASAAQHFLSILISPLEPVPVVREVIQLLAALVALRGHRAVVPHGLVHLLLLRRRRRWGPGWRRGRAGAGRGSGLVGVGVLPQAEAHVRVLGPVGDITRFQKTTIIFEKEERNFAR